MDLTMKGIRLVRFHIPTNQARNSRKENISVAIFNKEMAAYNYYLIEGTY